MSKPDVILVVDLPNLMRGAKTNFKTLRALLENCVQIARKRGHVIFAYAVGDLRHFFSVLDELEPLVIRLGLTLLHAPTLRGGQQEKETVDAKIKEVLSLIRFLGLEPLTILLVSDDRDFAVDLAGLRNAGHCVETVSRSHYTTLLGTFADEAHIVAESTAAPMLHAALQTFVREHWRDIRSGAFSKTVSSSDRLDDLTPHDQGNLLLAVLIMDLLTREKSRKTNTLWRRDLISRLQHAPEHFVAKIEGDRAHWLIARLIESRAIIVADRVVSLSPDHPLVNLVSTEWLPKRREIEAEVAEADETEAAGAPDIDDAPSAPNENDAPSAAAGNGDGRPASAGKKRTADEVSDQELFEALRSVFGRLGDEETDYRSGRLEAALVTELHLKGRPEGGRLKMHALRRGFVHKTGAQESSFVFTPPLES